MFERILLPIDGSQQSLQAAATGVALAAHSGRKAVGLEILEPLSSVALAADALVRDSSGHAHKAMQQAREDLAEVASLARQAHVAFEDGYVFDRRPYTAIVAAAHRAGCDLIVIGAGEYARSHHARLSHEVSLLLNCADVPVLVCP